MKQLYLIVVLAFSFTLYGQNNWPKEGAQWALCSTWIDWPGGQVFNNESSVIYAKDTLINGVIYQVSEEISGTGSVNLQVFTRFQNDTIFRLIDQNEYLFFTYNTTAGDTLSMRRTGINDYNEDTCSFSLELKCTEIFEITIEGNNYTCWEFQDVGNSVYGANNIGSDTEHSELIYWLETIGWLDYFPWVTQPLEQYCNYGVYDGGSKFIYRYNDHQINLSLSGQSHQMICDTTLQIKENFNHNTGISLYPNPTLESVNISGLDSDISSYAYEIQDQLGRIVAKKALINQKIDVSPLTNGMYHLLIYDNNTLVYNTKFIKE